MRSLWKDILRTQPLHAKKTYDDVWFSGRWESIPRKQPLMRQKQDRCTPKTASLREKQSMIMCVFGPLERHTPTTISSRENATYGGWCVWSRWKNRYTLKTASLRTKIRWCSEPLDKSTFRKKPLGARNNPGWVVCFRAVGKLHPRKKSLARETVHGELFSGPLQRYIPKAAW